MVGGKGRGRGLRRGRGVVTVLMAGARVEVVVRVVWVGTRVFVGTHL